MAKRFHKWKNKQWVMKKNNAALVHTCILCGVDKVEEPNFEVGHVSTKYIKDGMIINNAQRCEGRNNG